MKTNFASRGFNARASRATSRDYSNGQAVYTQGDAANALYRVASGGMKSTIRSHHGHGAVISLARAGDCFGEGCLVAGGARRTSTVTSIGDSTIERVTKVEMLGRLRKEPVLARLFIAHLLLRVADSEDDRADQILNTSERRLARLLLRMAAFTKDSKQSVSVASLDQATLAQMVGTTRSRVSFFMNRFRKQGLIDYNGRLHVHKGLLAFLAEPVAA